MKFTVPVIWEMYGQHIVEAETIEQAKEIALSKGCPDGNYIGASLTIDEEGLYIYNEEE